MSDECAIEARYVNHKNVQGRGVLQVILEIPVEHTVEFFNKFGHPDPGKEKRVGLALLATETNEVSVKYELSKNAEKAKRKFEDLPYSQQAALLCKDERFYEILYDAIAYRVFIDSNNVVEELRNHLNIKSRSELDDVNNTIARNDFQNIRDDYRAHIGSYPEQRG